MSIIIQAGHKSSKSKQLMEKLYERGLSRPADSYTHKMTPQQVSETLYKLLARENMSSANEKMVDNVMTDFLLANLDSENWGWESDKKLASLEYWEQIEPDVRFILVFDHPNNILKEFTNVALTSDMVDKAMNEWVDYHQEILSFLEENSDNKVILIEGSCAIENISNLGEKMKCLSDTLQLKSNWQILGKGNSLPTYFDLKTNKQNAVVSEHIIDEILRKYPEVIEMFNKLLSKASMKCSEQIYKTKRTELDRLVLALNYLKEYEDSQKYLLENKKLNEEVNSIKNMNAQRIGLLEIKYKEIVLENNENQKLINQYKAELNQLRKAESKPSADTSISTKRLKKESDILLEQLHYTQEELEKYYLESQSRSSTSLDEKINGQQQSKTVIYYGAAERVKQDLPYRLGATMVSQSKSAKGLAILPLSLAREYNNFKKTGVDKQSLPEIEDYYDSDEAERVKEHLSYKLGKTITDGFSSPYAFISLPISIGKEVLKFKND